MRRLGVLHRQLYALGESGVGPRLIVLRKQVPTVGWTSRDRGDEWRFGLRVSDSRLSRPIPEPPQRPFPTFSNLFQPFQAFSQALSQAPSQVPKRFPKPFQPKRGGLGWSP